MIETSQQLGAFLRQEARALGLTVAFDTHFDAGNWVLSWWHAGRRHRLDFQPMRTIGFNVTHYQDHIPWLPGALVRTLDALGFFRSLARTEWTAIETGRLPITEERVRTILTDCHAAHTTRDSAGSPFPRTDCDAAS